MFSFVVGVHVATVDLCHRLTVRLEICFELEVENKHTSLYYFATSESQSG